MELLKLEQDLNAKLSDFGLARDGPTGDKTHISTRVVGTRGYAAPEYVVTGQFTLGAVRTISILFRSERQVEVMSCRFLEQEESECSVATQMHYHNSSEAPNLP